MTAPRVLVAGLSGGGGKTLVAVGMLAAWRERGHAVAAFKKGPDYIDAAWLSRAGGTPCRNLDLFLMSADAIVGSFTAATSGVDTAVIEGNRGLYDGVDAQGTYATAELAKLLHAPVLLVVDGVDLTVSGKVTFFGLIFSLDRTGAKPQVSLSGGPLIYGSIIVDHEDADGESLKVGGGTARYDGDVLANLSGRTPALTYLPGGWSDFPPRP